MSRRVYLLGVGIALLALGLAVTDLLLPHPGRVTKANVQRVIGLTLEEAKAVLGNNPNMLPSNEGQTGYVWISRAGCAWVFFDDLTGRAEYSYYTPPNDPSYQPAIRLFGYPPEPGPLARLRTWLGW